MPRPTKIASLAASESISSPGNADTGSPRFRASHDPRGLSADIYTIGVHLKSLPGKLGVITILRRRNWRSRKPRCARRSLGQESRTALRQWQRRYTGPRFRASRAGWEYLLERATVTHDGKHESFDNLSRPTSAIGVMDIYSWQNAKSCRFMGSVGRSKRSRAAVIAWSGSRHARFVLHQQRGAARRPRTTDGRYGINPNSAATLARKSIWSPPTPSSSTDRSRGRHWALFCGALRKKFPGGIGGARVHVRTSTHLHF